MTSSGYTPLPSDPPPAYAAGTPATGSADPLIKDAPQPAMPAYHAYPGMCVYIIILCPR